jgi:PhzF family phenazine biosynthesis protein
MKTYYISAFTHDPAHGNPAAVCLLENELPDNQLQEIATQNNFPVTAFLLKKNHQYFIKWFTPEYELELCGHGSLAAGFVVLTILEKSLNEIIFHRNQKQILVKKKNHLIEITFPIKEIEKIAVPDFLIEGLGAEPDAVYQHHNERLLVIFHDENLIRKMQPNFDILKKLNHRGIVVTAPSTTVDFVSRTFYPHKKDKEDAVTGASHCLLVPYWAKQLKKNKLHAAQVSARGGELFCELNNNHVIISGEAVISS